MKPPKKDGILEVNIGNVDIMDWLTITGKDIVMPEMLKATEKLFYQDLKQCACIIINAKLGSSTVTLELIAIRSDIDDSLLKILNWAIKSEEYEMCARVKKLQEFIKKQNEQSV